MSKVGLDGHIYIIWGISNTKIEQGRTGGSPFASILKAPCVSERQIPRNMENWWVV